MGLYLNSDFNWNTHVEKISIDLKKRIGLLRRIRNRIPVNKLVIIAEAIFNSKIRYGISVYLNPIFDEEELKMEKLSKNTQVLQVLQNAMIRIVFGFNKNQYINMKKKREKLKMMSVNQICCYHTLLDAYNIVKNSSSDQIKMKWSNKHENKYLLRSESKNDQIIPEKPMSKCLGFSYSGAKLFNKLPSDIKGTTKKSIFKSFAKDWIWKNIPSY